MSHYTEGVFTKTEEVFTRPEGVFTRPDTDMEPLWYLHVYVVVPSDCYS
jgi:hypothetical protein